MRLSSAVVIAVIAVLAAVQTARGEEPEVALPQLGEAQDVRIDMPGGDTNMIVAPSPDGRYLAVCYAPRSDDDRRADSWTALRMIDLRGAQVKGAWDGLDMGSLPPAFSRDGRLFAYGTRKDASTLTVCVRACQSARGTTQDVPHEPGTLGFAEVCGLSGNAQRVAIREPGDANGSRHLMVQEITKGRRIARFADFTEPYYGMPGARVVLTGRSIAFHHWPIDQASGGRSRLRVVELDTSRVVADTTGFAARTSARYAVTPDLRRLVNGTADFEIESIDLTTGERTLLIDASDLRSHFLEVLLSTDGKRVVTWSDEQKLILARDLDGGEPLRAELDFRAHVVGISADGRWAYVRVHDRGLVAVDLDAGSVAGVVVAQLPDWVRMTPDGAYLVTRATDEKGCTFTIRPVTAP